MALTLRQPSEARRWLVAWALFSVLGGLWALSSPLFSVPDEPSHAVYAAAAVRGELWQPSDGSWTRVTVPADFADAGRIPICFAFHPEVPAGCSPAFGGKTGLAETTTSAGRYPPAYYLYAGLGTLVTTGAKALYLMRLLTVLLVAALLASATCSALRTRRPRLALAGMGLAVTPMVLYFSGAVNPQGPEIAAAVGVWVSGYLLLSELRREPGTRLTWKNPYLRRTVLAMVALSLARPLSLLWLAITVGALVAALITRESARRLLTSPAVLTAVPVLAVTAGSTVAWVALRNTLGGQAITAYAHTPVTGAAIISTAKVNDELLQMIGVFGWLDTSSPGIVYVSFLAALGALGLLTLALGGRRIAVVLALLAVAVVVIPVVGELVTYKQDAFPWQGRYTLPIAVGVPLLLGLTLATSPRDFPMPVRRITAAFGGVFVLINIVAFVGTLNRYIKSVNGFFGASPSGWNPPVPVVALGLAMLVALTACAVLAGRVRGEGDEEAAERPGAPDAPGRVRVGAPPWDATGAAGDGRATPRRVPAHDAAGPATAEIFGLREADVDAGDRLASR
ncbi:MAG: putative rane protein [Frankiales bacterium]|nr:putative rane protein [Frankiales bacterium]